LVDERHYYLRLTRVLRARGLTMRVAMTRIFIIAVWAVTIVFFVMATRKAAENHRQRWPTVKIAWGRIVPKRRRPRQGLSGRRVWLIVGGGRGWHQAAA